MTIDIVTAASSAWSRGQQLLRQMRGRKAQNKNTKKMWMIKMVVDDITCFEDRKIPKSFLSSPSLIIGYPCH